MKNQWQLHEAQEHFTDIFEEALHSGPQIIRQQNGDMVILLSIYEYDKLRTSKPAMDLVDFFQNSPLYGIELDLQRDKDMSRKVEL